MDEFSRLADRFRRAVGSGDAGLELLADATIQAARAVSRAIDDGRLHLDGLPQWEKPTGDLPPWKIDELEADWFRVLWRVIALRLPQEHPAAMPFDALAMRLISANGFDEVRFADPQDWRRHAENYAVICDWLASNVETLEGDISAYRSLRELCLLRCGGSYKKATKLLKDNPWIRTRQESKQRRSVHSGDWLKFCADEDRKANELLASDSPAVTNLLDGIESRRNSIEKKPNRKQRSIG